MYFFVKIIKLEVYLFFLNLIGWNLLEVYFKYTWKYIWSII